MFGKGCMMKILCVVFFVLLSGCARETTVTDDVFSGIHTEIAALEQQLPPECKTDATAAKISAITTQVWLAQKSCKKDIAACKSEARLWRFRFYGVSVLVVGLILLWAYRKVRKVL